MRANLLGRGVALLATPAVLVVACSDAEPTPLQNVGGGWHVVPGGRDESRRLQRHDARGAPTIAAGASVRFAMELDIPASLPASDDAAQKLRIRIVSP